MDRDEMGNLYRGPSRDASYQISINLGKRFQRRFFQKSTNQKQEWPVVAMFTGRNEQSLQKTFHRCFLPSFGSFGQAVSEENFFFQKSTNHKQELSVAAMFINGSEEMCNLKRGPSIDHSTKFSFIWPSSFKREDFLKSTN